jgi:photosystem II stability/assembly factor-like uncharacterized protein
VGSLPAKAGAHVVLIDPNDPRRVYAAGDGDLFRSDDAGQIWELASQGLPDGGVAALALDPREPRRLYAAATTGALYLTEDGASSWRALPGAVRSAGS